MRKILLVFVIILVSSLISRSQDTDVTYKVTNYEIDGRNYDQLALSRDVALSFYMCDENTLCFTNHWRKTDSQSFGSVHALRKREFQETTTIYGGVEFKFTWNYSNTFDSRKGQAVVTITHFFIGSTIKFAAEIILLDTNEILKFQGYVE